MRRRMRPVGPVGPIAVAMAIAGCAPTVTTIPQTLTPVRPTEVALAVPPEVAYDRTVAAFAAEGLAIAQGDRQGGVIKSAGVMGDLVTVSGSALLGVPPSSSQQEQYYRANVVRTGLGATVLLSVSLRSHDYRVGSGGSAGNAEVGPERERYACDDVAKAVKGYESAKAACRAQEEKINAKLAALAARVRGSP